MSLIKIPDSVLEELHCQCGQYLSKAPVNIQNGKGVCSDCIDKQNPTPVALQQNFQYEALANLFAFPCRYKPQGCPKHIQFNKLENHEAECLYHSYECPFNLHSPGKCIWKGTTSQFCQHYESKHPELYLQTPKFEINLYEDNELYYLIKIDDILLLLQIKCSLADDIVWFSMVCLKQEESAKLINYVIKLSRTGNNSARIMKLEAANPLPITNMNMRPILCLNVKIQTLKDFLNQPDFIECHWDINITEEFKLKMKSTNQELEEEELLCIVRNEDLKCVNCNFSMVPPIYRCPKGHNTCIDCKGYYNQCKTCQNVDVTFTAAEDLERIAKSKQHYCRWIKCQKMLTCDEVREHEQKCPARVYICPECVVWSGSLEQLLEHFRSVHSEIQFLVTTDVGFNLKYHKLMYAMAHYEIFKIDYCKIFGINEFSMNIRFLGSPNFINCWKYNIVSNLRSNQLNLEKCEGNNFWCSFSTCNMGSMHYLKISQVKNNYCLCSKQRGSKSTAQQFLCKPIIL